MQTVDLATGLPGEALVREGLAHLSSGRCSIPGCLAQMAGPRLRRAGLMASTAAEQGIDAELQLYRLLREQGGDAYSRYNALVRELVSFEQALDRRMREALGSGIQTDQLPGSHT